MSETVSAAPRDNMLVAEKLNAVAVLLGHQNANPFRVRAYRDAAAYVAGLARPIGDIFAKGGIAALEDLPTIGPSIAAAIMEILQTGDLRLLTTLRGDQDPEKLLQTVPQIGPHLAAVIHDDLGIDTLEELEMAAADGRLSGLPGFGPRRVKGIQYALQNMLARGRPLVRAGGQPAPPVADLLEVDRTYRSAAREGRLPMITPRRFNPDRAAWLPIMHTERGDWHYTAMFSNTLRAHQLRRTGDWVVIRYEKDHAGAGQCTVVTEQKGELAGKRVIRGRESACAHFYANLPVPVSSAG